MKNLQLLCLAGFILFSDYLYAIKANDPNYFTVIAGQIAKKKEGGILNLSFKSTIDDTIQPLLIKIPKGYDPAKKWPLLIVLHGLGDGPIIVQSIDSIIQIGPFGRGDLWYRGLGEKDVLESLEIAKKLFSVDDERVYLTGFSMGASGTFELGLKYPHIWAACVPVCGKLENPRLIENGCNLPFWIQAGAEDNVIPCSYSKTIYETGREKGFSHWRYTENKGMGHSFRVDWKSIEKWMLEQHCETHPQRIVYIGDVPLKTYWIEVLDLIAKEKTYRVEVSVDGNKVLLKTENVKDYLIDLNECPVSSSTSVFVYENGKEISLHKDKNGILRKNVSEKLP